MVLIKLTISITVYISVIVIAGGRQRKKKEGNKKILLWLAFWCLEVLNTRQDTERRNCTLHLYITYYFLNLRIHTAHDICDPKWLRGRNRTAFVHDC